MSQLKALFKVASDQEEILAVIERCLLGNDGITDYTIGDLKIDVHKEGVNYNRSLSVYVDFIHRDTPTRLKVRFYYNPAYKYPLTILLNHPSAIVSLYSIFFECINLGETKWSNHGGALISIVSTSKKNINRDLNSLLSSICIVTEIEKKLADSQDMHPWHVVANYFKERFNQ